MSRPTRSTWTLILAAGASSRFGGPKALALWNGKTLLANCIQTAESFSGENVLVVTGGHAETLAPHLVGVKSIFNKNWTEGMSTSIIAGFNEIQKLDPGVNTILILPVDQPLVSREHLKKLESKRSETDRCTLTKNTEGTIGAPAAVPREFFPRVKDLRADRGLKSILKESEVETVVDSRSLVDVDHPDDLDNLKSNIDKPSGAQ